jgi:arginase
VLAGDDTAAVGVIAGLQQADGAGAQIGIVWLDAHGDFNTPETSYSGILAGMPLAIIAGLAGPHWRQAAGLAAPISTDRILLAGIRELDEKEESLLRSTAVHLVTANELRASEKFADSLARLKRTCDLIALHIDLDVLDPHLVPSSSTPSAGGLELAEASSAISAVLETGAVAAVTLTSLNPGGGQRGQRSIQSTLALLEQSLTSWTTIPGASNPS